MLVCCCFVEYCSTIVVNVGIAISKQFSKKNLSIWIWWCVERKKKRKMQNAFLKKTIYINRGATNMSSYIRVNVYGYCWQWSCCSLFWTVASCGISTSLERINFIVLLNFLKFFPKLGAQLGVAAPLASLLRQVNIELFSTFNYVHLKQNLIYFKIRPIVAQPAPIFNTFWRF